MPYLLTAGFAFSTTKLLTNLPDPGTVSTPCRRRNNRGRCRHQCRSSVCRRSEKMELNSSETRLLSAPRALFYYATKTSQNYTPFSVEIIYIQIVTDVEVTIESYFPEVGNIPRGRRMRGIFPTEGKQYLISKRVHTSRDVH